MLSTAIGKDASNVVRNTSFSLKLINALVKAEPKDGPRHHEPGGGRIKSTGRLAQEDHGGIDDNFEPNFKTIIIYWTTPQSSGTLSGTTAKVHVPMPASKASMTDVERREPPKRSRIEQVGKQNRVLPSQQAGNGSQNP